MFQMNEHVQTGLNKSELVLESSYNQFYPVQTNLECSRRIYTVVEGSRTKAYISVQGQCRSSVYFTL